MFGDEPYGNYNRILLSPVLAGEQTVGEIILNPLSWYEEHGITLHKGRKVVRVDRVPGIARELMAQTGEWFRADLARQISQRLAKAAGGKVMA